MTTRKRRIAVVTGSRAEYGLLRPVLRAVQAHSTLQLQLIVTGLHLLKAFGATVEDIQADGFRIDARVQMHTTRDGDLSQARALSRGVIGLARCLERLGSHIVVVLGDRVEALAAALAACTTNRFIAHIHGGDVAPGHLDDSFRHAISKLSHIHLAATRDAAERLVRLGERPNTVRFVGAPGLDELLPLRRPAQSWLCRRFGFTKDCRVALVVQHAIGRQARAEQQIMNHLLRAVEELDLSALMIYPNNDAGHSGIVTAIRQAVRRPPPQRIAVPSLPRAEFLKCLACAQVMVGNSSAGILEAPYLGTPAVNIGRRQEGRLRAGPAVFDCSESTAAIKAALRQALDLPTPPRPDRFYGTGQAGTKIATILARTALSDKLRRKRIHY